MLTKWAVLTYSFLLFILVASEALAQKNLPSLITKIQPSVVTITIYDSSGDSIGQGSGFFVSEAGDLVTNHHVVEGASRIEIRTSDGKFYSVKKVVAVQETADLVRLSVSIPRSAVKPIIVSRRLPEVGQRVIVIGSPLGLYQTVSDGIVSAVRDVSGFGKIIQITAPISSGSSGSPVVNMKGEVIGVATFALIEGQNINFAIPGDRVIALGTEHKLEKELRELRAEREKLETERKRLEEERRGRLVRPRKDEDAQPERKRPDTGKLPRKDNAEGLRGIRKTADQGDALYQTILGGIYAYGLGVPQDYAEAARWYRKAADQGDADAQYHLGFMYDYGQGVTQDYTAAMRWYRKAADQGKAYAQYKLGNMYDYGQGVPQDYAEAARWYRKAADQGDAGAQYNLGVMYFKGQGVTQDYGTALRWYRKVADQGDANAQYNLGNMYFKGQGVTQDYGTALRWYRKAAEQGTANAQVNLGVMYHMGNGVTQDYGTALRWYRKAANQGEALAQMKLGLMYNSGLGVTQDYVQAHMWYNLAAAQGDKNAREFRDSLAEKMTPDQVAEAQKLAREWKPKGN